MLLFQLDDFYCVDELPECLTQFFPFQGDVMLECRHAPQVHFWPGTANVSVNMCAIYNRRMMLAFYFDKVLEVQLDVIKGSCPCP